jgi:LPXTG-site transpeptidase (sortase) family protein
MLNTLLPNADDENDKSEDHKDLKSKKEKVIQPISSDSKRSTFIPGASEEILEELRKKTAELASKVEDDDEVESRVLVLDQDEETEKITKQIDKNTKKLDPEIQVEDNPAANVIRKKLEKLYKSEPDAAEEALESYQAGKHRSKHQKFMYELTTSGKSLADIQTEWHNYYIGLDDEEKHEVWKEFYETQNESSRLAKKLESKPEVPEKKPVEQPKPLKKKPAPLDPRSVGEIKSTIMDKVSAGGKLKASHHFKSLLFGLGLASLVGLIISFTFFNQVFIAPFISPSKSVSATPIIGSQSDDVSDEPKIIVPKINLEVPVVFGLNTINEADVQNALEDGVVHYSTTPFPGEQGNSVIVGHSSNNILNSGKYKFAFVLLKRLESEDLFYVQKDGVRYTYKVYKKEIVGPNEVSVLGKQDKANTMTLITCDPPGTSINRLIIVGEQIYPDPSGNKESSAIEVDTTESTEELPSNAPSLWSRLWPF